MGIIMLKKTSSFMFTRLFIIPRTVLLSSIQPEPETLDFSAHGSPRNLWKSSHHVNTNKGSIDKLSGNDVEGCPSQKVLFISTQHAHISVIQCK